MLELSAVHECTAEKMRSILVDLGWSAFEAWMHIIDPVIRGAQLYRQLDEVEVKEVCAYVLSKHYLLYIMSSSCSSSGDVRGGEAGPQVEGRHPQFPNLPALIDGRVVAEVARQNKCREPKKIPYGIPIFEPGTPLMAKTKSTLRIRSPDEFLAEGTIGNPSVLPQSNPGAETTSCSSSTSSRSGSLSSAAGQSSRSSSSQGASTSASPTSSPRPSSSLPKRKNRTPRITEIVAEGTEFPGAPTRSDPQDGPRSHVPNPKAVVKMKRSALEKQYLLPTKYSFVLLEPDATMNEPPSKCIAVYRAALSYGVRFPLHPRAPKETGDLGWYCLNNGLGFMTAIEKKSKLKYWKYDFLFVCRESGWSDVPDWNEGKLI
ncbi:hypothetical protein Cgig2_014135 [Carnegiea gigantea]|uniref:Uncharacterized protein n=1 Tax=Carnegiea gigantea TaxID=171969 RepID=A0A9Q1JY19_9CARY|nr:hypothetical protein Cgig2_014135 [Carnegiea gigantea]